MDTDERITDLETLLAHQGRTIEELSGELARQGDVIGRLERALRALGNRFLALEEAAIPAAENRRPPHY